VQGGGTGAHANDIIRARACKPTLPHPLLHSPTVHMPMKANGR